MDHFDYIQINEIEKKINDYFRAYPTSIDPVWNDLKFTVKKLRELQRFIEKELQENFLTSSKDLW